MSVSTGFIFQEKILPKLEEEEEDDQTLEKETARDCRSPYESAIESYRSFAKSKLNGSNKVSEREDREDSGNGSDTQQNERSSTVSKSCSTSSMSSSPAPRVTKSRSPPQETRNDDAWEEKIETFVQPARRVSGSSEISEKMKMKLASFEDSRSGKDQTPVRLIEPDNSFKDKLKAFKTIESQPSGPAKPSRRESEPCLQNAKHKSALGYRSTSSSFMNTFQNNKFFQQVTSTLNATPGQTDPLSGHHQAC